MRYRSESSSLSAANIIASIILIIVVVVGAIYLKNNVFDHPYDPTAGTATITSQPDETTSEPEPTSTSRPATSTSEPEPTKTSQPATPTSKPASNDLDQPETVEAPEPRTVKLRLTAKGKKTSTARTTTGQSEDNVCIEALEEDPAGYTAQELLDSGRTCTNDDTAEFCAFPGFTSKDDGTYHADDAEYLLAFDCDVEYPALSITPTPTRKIITSVETLTGKSGGYTEQELLDSGRSCSSYGFDYCKFPGFYLAPNGNHFPNNAQSLAGYDCDSNYSDACIRVVTGKLSCYDVALNEFYVVGEDVHGFDTDGDGICCEPGE